MKHFENEEVKQAPVYCFVSDVIKNVRSIEERKAILFKNLCESPELKPVGSGGVGRLLINQNKEVFMQISCGMGKWNYAYVVKIGHMRPDNGVLKNKFIGVL